MGTDRPGYLRLVNAALEQTEHSPMPNSEWAPLTQALGEELLAQLVGISPSSLRRYAALARATPDDVAGRLHVLALLVADLAGGYNDYGVRAGSPAPGPLWAGGPPASCSGRASTQRAPTRPGCGTWPPGCSTPVRPDRCRGRRRVPARRSPFSGSSTWSVVAAVAV